MKKFFFGAAALLFCATAFAATDPASCIVTVQRVELKDDRGRWMSVVEPDHQADLVTQAAGFSFFNNGRVVPGSYINFRVTLLPDVKFSTPDGRQFSARVASSDKGVTIEGTDDFKEPFRVKNGDYIAVWFALDLTGTLSDEMLPPVFTPPAQVKHATVVIGEAERSIDRALITIHYNR